MARYSRPLLALWAFVVTSHLACASPDRDDAARDVPGASEASVDAASDVARDAFLDAGIDAATQTDASDASRADVALDAVTGADAVSCVAPSAPCVARNAAEWVACAAAANLGTVDAIDIAARIDCTAPAACRAPITRALPLTIRGITPDAGFVRHANYHDYLLSVANARPLVIRDLLLDDDVATACAAPPCGSTAAINSSTDVLIDNLTLRGSKLLGLEIGSSTNVIIRRSRFEANAVHGVWLSAAPETINHRVRVEASTFSGSGAPGISFSAIGTMEFPNVISGCTFTHNHRDSVYHVCGSTGDQPCSGGQLVLEHNLFFAVIERNVIRDGAIDAYPTLGTSGIEIAPNDVSDIVIRDNDIHDNTGTGIVLDAPSEPIERLTVTNNRVYANRYGDIYLTGATAPTVRDNCTTAGCPLAAMPTGTLAAMPDPCVLDATGVCTSVITWTTAGGIDVSVRVGDGLFGHALNASNTAPWINESGVRFDLYDGWTLLADRVVRGRRSGCP